MRSEDRNVKGEGKGKVKTLIHFFLLRSERGISYR